ncbi:MAG: VWA domain-containing protein [Kiritimatiellaeota bacterium]|nr:VWA domain-containing protein [Kiritimatiellota bacterium]
MFSLLAPQFLIAGIALLLPLVLHLIQSNRTVRLPFSTIRFLKLAAKRSSRRVKMEHFLLWLLRTLLLAALVLAFAMPMIRTKDFRNFLGQAARDVAIVVDASYSMGYKTGERTVWNQASELAAEIIAGLSEKDRFCVYLATSQVTPIYEQLTGAKEREAAGTRLRGLKLGYDSSQLCPALIAANKTLEQEQRRTEREIHIISDTHALPWERFQRDNQAIPAQGPARPEAQPAAPSPSGNLWDPNLINERTTCFVTLLGSPAPENAAPTDIALEPQLITPATAAKLTVRLARTGPARETTATVFVDDKEVARRSAVIGNSGEIELLLPPVGHGVHVVRVETPDDSLPVDNAFHFLMRARQKLPVLCVGSKDNSLFLRAALSVGLGGVSPIEAKYIQPDQLSGEQLSSYVCVFLCNVLPLPGQEIVRLEQYLRAGGLAVLFPGDGAQAADYKVWSCLPGTPASIAELPVAERKRLLTWDKPQHPLFGSLKEGGLAPALAVKRSLRYTAFQEKAATLISTGTGHPFLVSVPFGRGEMFLFSVSADRGWSDFPLSPFYLPIMHQIVHYAAGVGASRPYQWCTDSLSLQEYLPEATRESVLKDPEGQTVSVRSAMVDGQAVLHAEGLTQPGLYTLTTPPEPAPHPALALNMPRAESNLTPIRPESVAALLGLKNLVVTTSRDELLRKLDESRVGRTLGEQFLWLALLIALLESFYSNWLTRPGGRLTDHLSIEASGKIARKA